MSDAFFPRRCDWLLLFPLSSSPANYCRALLTHSALGISRSYSLPVDLLPTAFVLACICVCGTFTGYCCAVYYVQYYKCFSRGYCVRSFEHSLSDLHGALYITCAYLFVLTMGPKRKPSDAAGGKAKRSKKVMTLDDKVKLLDKLKEGHSYASVGRSYEVNESTVRYIKKNEVAIRNAYTKSAGQGKYVKRLRNTAIVRMEAALSIWIEDQHKKGIGIDSVIIREKARSLFERFKLAEPDSGSVSELEPQPSTSTAEPMTSRLRSPETQEDFTASKGWFDRFKKRFSLHNVKLSGEAGSADHDAAAAYPEELKRIIEEGGYLPEQIFNADESALFWKKMPSRTFISKEESKAPGFKAAKDRLTLLFCGNAAGHMIKPGLIYKSQNPRALKNKDKNLLPVYWQSNKKAWTTKALFMEWFHRNFVPEVRRYLQDQELEFKVLLILDNAPGHPESIHQVALEMGVEVVFLPPNTTSLIQPMDQGVIRTFKSYYTRRSLQRIISAMDTNEDLDVREYWKRFTIADCLMVIETALADLKPQTVNACWKKLWPECVHDFMGFDPGETQGENMKKILQMARQVGGEGFSDLNEKDVDDLIEEHADPLTDQDLEELTKSASEEEEQQEDDDAVNIEPEGLSLRRLGNFFRSLKSITEDILEWDPCMQRSIKFGRELEQIAAPYKVILEELKRKKTQLPITYFFSQKVRQGTSTVSTPSSTATPTRASMPARRSITPSPLPPSSPVAVSEGDPDDPSGVTDDDPLALE